MILSVEEEQERVSTELDQPTASAVGESEERGEHRPYDVGDLLGPDLPRSSQSLERA